jgi:proline iminopeptidase
MKFASLLFFAFCLTTCREDTFYEGDFFFLVHKKAQMPVAVRGNLSSNVLIVFLHGGPGGTALQKIGLPAFRDLEQRYATVFWDQRGSGSSQGNSPGSLLNLDQFTEDLDKLVDLLRARYPSAAIFLMGHSWGGCLGTSYLTDAARQQKITGWIEVDGAHNNPKADTLSMKFVRSFANSRIANGTDERFWNYVLDWYDANPNFTSDQLEHYAFVDKANGYLFNPDLSDTEKFPNYSFDYLFDSPANVTAALTNYHHVIHNFVISDIDLTPRMKNITLPSLIIWGAHDGIIPYPMATHALDALGTTPENKSLATLPNSAHNGFYEEPERFSEAVKTFVEKYR